MSIKTAKKILCIALATLTALTMAACGGSTENPTKDSNKTGGNSDNNTSEVLYIEPDSTIGYNGKDYADYNPYEGIEKYKGQKIKFATWIDHTTTEAASVIKSFEKKYGIDVELVYCSQDGYVKELQALIAGGNAPDIFVDNADFPFTLQIAQEFSVTGVDLNEPIWSQPVIHAHSVGNKVYAVNTMNSVWHSCVGVIYNRELMESNGIKTPAEYKAENNWTWETMKNCMAQVNALGKDYHGGVIADPIKLIGSMGVGVVDYDYKTGTFTNTMQDSRVVKANQFVAELNKEGLLTENSSFTQGKTGMVITDAYGIKTTGYYSAMDGLDLAFIDTPDADANTKAVKNGLLRAYGIVNGAKNAEAAGMFLRYFLDPANYDMKETFVSTDTAKSYYDILGQMYHGGEDSVFYDYAGVAKIIGRSIWTWVNPHGLDPSQVAAKLASYNNEVDSAVKKANELVNKMK